MDISQIVKRQMTRGYNYIAIVHAACRQITLLRGIMGVTWSLHTPQSTQYNTNTTNTPHKYSRGLQTDHIVTWQCHSGIMRELHHKSACDMYKRLVSPRKYNTNTLEIQHKYKYYKNTIQTQCKCDTNKIHDKYLI